MLAAPEIAAVTQPEFQKGSHVPHRNISGDRRHGVDFAPGALSFTVKQMVYKVACALSLSGDNDRVCSRAFEFAVLEIRNGGAVGGRSGIDVDSHRHGPEHQGEGAILITAF